MRASPKTGDLRRVWEQLLRSKWDIQLIHRAESLGLLDHDALNYLERRARTGQPLLECDRCLFLASYRLYIDTGTIRHVSVGGLARMVRVHRNTLLALFQTPVRVGPRELRALVRVLIQIGLRPEQINAPHGLVILGERPALWTPDAFYPGRYGSITDALIGADAPLSVVRYVEQWLDTPGPLK